MSYQETLDRFCARVAQGQPVIGGGAGTDITMKPAEAGGIDLLVTYNSGRSRMAGCSSLSGLLAYGDVNIIVMEMANEVPPVVKRTSVPAGVNDTDPSCVAGRFLRQVKEVGFANIQNFPTADLIDEMFRVDLEGAGMGYRYEIDMVRMAHEFDLFTSPYVFDGDQARDMARAGTDILVSHMGLVASGTIGAKTALTLKEAVAKVQQLADAARSVNPDIPCLCHGRPIANPAGTQYILDRTDGIVDFYGVSSVERFPTEVGIRAQTEEFRVVIFKKG